MTHKTTDYEFEVAALMESKCGAECRKYISCKDCPYWRDGYETHCKMIWVVQNLEQIVEWVNLHTRGTSEQIQIKTKKEN